MTGATRVVSGNHAAWSGQRCGMTTLKQQQQGSLACIEHNEAIGIENGRRAKHAAIKFCGYSKIIAIEGGFQNATDARHTQEYAIELRNEATRQEFKRDGSAVAGRQVDAVRRLSHAARQREFLCFQVRNHFNCAEPARPA